MKPLARRLLKWYGKNKRVLPWRGKRDPYAVWVSEIMLQQTRVEAVIPYYARWMERFPTVAALASASEREALTMWEGLGYYARARNLRKAAEMVQERYGGELPHNAEELRKLPGIGRYTAGAISSIAFGCDEPALDGNIRRVLARVFNLTQLADSAGGMKTLWRLTGEQLPKGHAGDYNQALMDLGATICVAGEPRCAICPVKTLCVARRLGVQAQRPVMTAKRVVPHHVAAAAVVVRGGRVLMARRPSQGLLGGMWEFPNAKATKLTKNSLKTALRRSYNLIVTCGEPLDVIHHGYSHFSVEVHPFRCTAASVPKDEALRWIRLSELLQYPMGRIDRQIAKMLV